MTPNETESFLLNEASSWKLKILDRHGDLELFAQLDDGFYSKVGEISRKLIFSKTMYKPRWVRWAIEVSQRQKAALVAKESK